jgi:tetratricopeptide (TPR) repeat protein
MISIIYIFNFFSRVDFEEWRVYNLNNERKEGKMKKAFLCSLAVFLFLSCPTSPVEQKIKEKMDSAEISLKEGKYDYAKMTYYEALKLDPSYTPAKFGVIISDIFDAIAKIQESIQILLPLIQMIQQAQQPQALSGVNYIVKNFLESAIVERMRNHLLCDEQGDTYHVCFDEIEKDPNFLFKAESIPLVVDVGFGPILSLDFGGVYNLGEAYFLEFIFSAVVGVAEILYTVDFNIDILGTFSFIFNSGIMDMFETNTLSAVLKLLGTILNANSNFLGFNGNTTDLLNSQTHLQNAFDSLLSSINDVKTRPFEGDTIFTVGKETNTILFRFYNKLRKDVKTSCTEEEKAGRNICVKMKVSDEITGAVENVSKSFHDPDFFISWVNDMAPLIAIVFQTLIDSAIVLDLIDFVTALLQLDPETLKMIETFKSFLSPGSLSADLIYGFLTGILGDVIQISPAKLFEQAKNNSFSLRGMLPVWTSYHDYTQGYPKTTAEADTLWLEWECGTSTVPPYDFSKPATNVLDGNLLYLVCSAEPSDAPHFFDTNVKVPSTIKITPLPQDGIKSTLPYFYIIDPTFASAVKINFSPLPEPLPTCGSYNLKEWHVPHDNCEVNGMIHKLLGPIIELIKGGGLPF